MSRESTYSPLRRLALDYADGRMSRSSYLQARARLLDELDSDEPVADEETVRREGLTEPTSEPDTEGWENEKTIPWSPTPAPPGPEQRPPPARSGPTPTPASKMPLVVAAAGGIAILIGVIVFGMWGANGEEPSENPTRPPPVETGAAERKE